ncbi:MAG: hypothetical protein ABI811_01320 [Acidobacteriota bacterium]
MLSPKFTRQAALVRAFVLPAILIYSLWMCWPATKYYFNTDDIASMGIARLSTYSQDLGSIFSVWNNHGRLAGSLFFRTLYDLFGFTALPFRLGSLLFCLLNLVLLNALLARLVRNSWVRYVAMLAAAFNGCFWSIYASAAIITDVLCLTFTLAGLLYYATTRRHPVGLARIVILALITVLAIAAKELGFALPVILMLFELVVEPGELPGYDWQDFKKAIPGLAVPFAVALVAGLGTIRSSAVYAMGAYRPEFTPARFLETLTAHSDLLVFRWFALPTEAWIAVWVALLLLALLSRSRVAIFGWCFYQVALLPMAFSTPRQDAYVLYVAFAGLLMFFAALLDRVVLRLPVLTATTLLGVLSCLIVYVQFFELRNPQFTPGGMSTVQSLAEDVLRSQPTIRPGADVLLVDDEFGQEGNQPVMIVRLVYADNTLHVWRRPGGAPGEMPPSPDLKFDHIFRFVGGHYVQDKQ